MNRLPTHVCIFVVDDNRDSAEMLTMLLELDGYRAHSFFDGSSALDAAAALHPAAAILDIDMEGMDGFELAARMRAALPAIRLIAYTARGEEAHDVARAKTAGFDNYLVKPAPIADIERALDVGRHTPASDRQFVAIPHQQSVAVSTNLPSDGSSHLGALALKYDDACDLERKLWLQVRGLHPGQVGHKLDEWQSWVQATHLVRMLELQMQP